MEDKDQAAEKARQADRGIDWVRLHVPILVAIIAFVGLLAWAYVDRFDLKYDFEVERLKVDIQKLGDGKIGPFDERKTEDADTLAEAPRETYAAAIGEYRFQIDLPDGHRLSIQEGGMGDLGAYVMSEPTAENPSPTPDMFISLVSLKIEAYASRLGNEEPGTRLVPTMDGEFAFWIRGWEDQQWPEFDKVAASFKAL